MERKVFGEEVKGQRAQGMGQIDCKGRPGWWCQSGGEKTVSQLPKSSACKGSNQDEGRHELWYGSDHRGEMGACGLRKQGGR